MKISCLRKDEWVEVNLHGQVDSFTYPLWAKELNVVMRTGTKKLRIDLSKGSIYHLTSLQLIGRIIQEMKDRGGEIEIVGADIHTSSMIHVMNNKRANDQDWNVKFI